MNIISNCCLGGFVYKDVIEQQFSNPFIWAWLNQEDMVYLVQNYDKINFKNYELSTYNNLPLKDEVCFQMNIDDKIKIIYSHYQFIKNKDTLEIDRKRNMVYHNRIWEYVVAKYNERLERMFSENKKPVFLICDNREGCGTFSKKQIEILSNTKYKVMFFSRYDYSQFNNANFISIQHDGNDIIQIKEKYKTEILDFIS